MPIPNCFGKYSKQKNMKTSMFNCEMICMYRTACQRKEEGKEPMLIQLDDPDIQKKIVSAPATQIEEYHVEEPTPDYQHSKPKKIGTLIKI